MNLSEEERQICRQLRNRIHDVEVTDEFHFMDFNMIRFLRGHNMDLDKAESVFRKYMGWRAEIDIDNALSWDIALDLRENVHYRITGVNLNGGIVICANVGAGQPANASGRYNELLKVAYHELQLLTMFIKHLALQTKVLEKMVAIINLEGLTFAHATTVDYIQGMITLLKAYEAYFPETLEVAFFVNVPWVFNLIWPIAKPLISSSTHQRLKLFGSDVTEWKEEITQFVAEDQFPAKFGGTLPDDCELVLQDDQIQVVRNPADSKINGNQDETSEDYADVDALD